ncbi:hypothetical protein BS47DRAFT_1019015 [Hydnum rufescens UP504]|uniref:Uncharacterized protein n=1 Tax=Hydnum rufescens UP504 TaxID=1448309 RepID=A0A9P6AYG2_9AGAM|nr:hypothetical protein BS47DRAFT_1019015 [Hydnum rufescens UP504]
MANSDSMMPLRTSTQNSYTWVSRRRTYGADALKSPGPRVPTGFRGVSASVHHNMPLLRTYAIILWISSPNRCRCLTVHCPPLANSRHRRGLRNSGE